MEGWGIMQSLTDKDYELIAEAQKVIRLNYDSIHENHTVGAAVRCKSGKIYTGVNVYSLHGACAEQIAIGTAITQIQLLRYGVRMVLKSYLLVETVARYCMIICLSVKSFFQLWAKIQKSKRKSCSHSHTHLRAKSPPVFLK